MSADVFEEAERGLDFRDDAGDMRPEVSRVFIAELFSGDGEWLARVAAMDDIHQAAPRSAIEGGKVVPDRCAIQGRVFHPRHERSRCVGFPLDVTHSAISGMGDVQSEIESACACAERKSGQTSPSVACVIASGGR